MRSSFAQTALDGEKRPDYCHSPTYN